MSNIPPWDRNPDFSKFQSKESKTTNSNINLKLTKDLQKRLSASKKGPKMKSSDIVKNIFEQNKEAAKTAAILEVGATATNIVVSKVGPQLPMMVRGYSEHPLFKVAIANATGAALKHFAGNNDKAVIVADAMIESAMHELVRNFNAPAMIEELLNGVDVTKIIAPPESE